MASSKVTHGLAGFLSEGCDDRSSLRLLIREMRIGKSQFSDAHDRAWNSRFYVDSDHAKLRRNSYMEASCDPGK